MKKLAQEANMRLSEAMSTQKVADIYTEFGSVKESLLNAQQELKTKENHIEFMRIELGKAQELEKKLEEEDASLDKLKEELSNAKASEGRVNDMLSKSEGRIQELEAEIERGKQSEAKIIDSLAAQTKQLEQTKIMLEESKLEIGSLHEELEKWGCSSVKSGSQDNTPMKEASERLKSEFKLANANLGFAEEKDKRLRLEAKSPLAEMELLRNELKLATEAEENSKKAMDDLALALKEVVTEANQVKEKLTLTQEELEKAKGEAENLKLKLKSTEAKLKVHLKEADRYRNTADRLRIEAEESLLAWNGKETGFVGCIKRAEDEKTAVLEENRKLNESVRVAENMTRTSKEENNKLRDILKQALNEANAAKEAAGIAKAENSQLKDALAEKDDALCFISRENENLRINQAAALENIKQLKHVLSEASSKELKSDKEKGRKLKPQNSTDKEDKKFAKSFSLNLKDLKIPHKHKDADEDLSKMQNKHNDSNRNTDEEESPETEGDPLRGSIFDMEESPVQHHRNKSSSAFTDDGVTINSDDFDHFIGVHFGDMDNDRNSRKKKALLRRFGDLLYKKRTYHHRKEPSLDD
ncbi:hypothetical protein CFOL_v3_27189 [Cephalotus follicularis]|uniref:DUF827 domain-containing protein n=1 Tax=Cephalotus follicularis TaxID=3775 RepID=A0A1Q3CUK4_CEPFO|nr:hypothetical protein CFOL_v3_27189 [Cephalotus follicularis]